MKPRKYIKLEWWRLVVSLSVALLSVGDLFSQEVDAEVVGFPGSEMELSFQQANRLMLEDKYEAAIERYEAVLKQRESEALNHNLGIAYFLNGEPGKAVLHFERAIRMGFASAETREILSLLRNSVGVSEPRYTLLQRVARSLPEGVWLGAVIVSFWGAVFFGFYIYVLVRRQSFYRDIAIGCGCLFILSCIACIGLSQDADHGVLIGKQIDLKVVPTTESENFLTLKGGEMARYLKSNNEYVFVETSSGVRAWVASDQFRWIRPK